jgi:hypothetical protein
MKKYFLVLSLAITAVLNYGCSKCKDIECFTPPNVFNFQLVDKDNGEDLVANGTFDAGQVWISSKGSSRMHAMDVSTDSTGYFFTDQEIGWETGPKNSSYKLRLNPSRTLPFTYETKEINEGCCTFFELVRFEMDSVEISFISQKNLFQLKI